MKVIFKTISEETNEPFQIRLGNNSINISDSEFTTCIEDGDRMLFFEGEIYYHIKDNKVIPIKKSECTEFLKKKLLNFKVTEFINSVEGIYNGVYLDTEKNETIIFCDYLNRKNFFYTESENTLTASTNLKNIIFDLSEIKYNQQGLLSYLTMGYTPSYQTFYEGVNRFTNNEYIRIATGKVSHEFITEKYEIENYDKSYLDKYDELISNSILSRSSATNFVLNSGGWDSTSIIYHLLKSHDAANVNSVVYETKLSNGDVYNIYEIDKVKRISDYYGIKSDKIEIDFNDKKLIDSWEGIRDELKNYHTYFFMDMSKAVHDIAQRNNSAAIFSGEASDSIHNFGFSQFVSVTYSNKELREYGDKMKSYLFSPSFFNSILEGDYSENKIFQFFRYYFDEKNFDGVHKTKEDLLTSYFKSFMLSSERVPFAKAISSSFASDSLQKKFISNQSKNIFDSIVSEATPQNLYYTLLQLYRYYHFHSPQIEVKHSPLRSKGNNCKIPFLDSSLVKFMYSMPESWGRGLELKPTKYPLRYLANERWDIPLHILEELGAHSYISESDKKWNYSGGSWSLNCEVIYNSVFGEHYKSILSEIEIEKYFSPDYFKTDLMKKAVDDFINGKQDLENVGFIYKLGVLFFIGLY